MIEWIDVTIVVHRWSRWLYYWSIAAYRRNDPVMVRDGGITYTAAGAYGKIRKFLFDSQ